MRFQPSAVYRTHQWNRWKITSGVLSVFYLCMLSALTPCFINCRMIYIQFHGAAHRGLSAALFICCCMSTGHAATTVDNKLLRVERFKSFFSRTGSWRVKLHHRNIRQQPSSKEGNRRHTQTHAPSLCTHICNSSVHVNIHQTLWIYHEACAAERPL